MAFFPFRHRSNGVGAFKALSSALRMTRPRRAWPALFVVASSLACIDWLASGERVIPSVAQVEEISISADIAEVGANQYRVNVKLANTSSDALEFEVSTCGRVLFYADVPRFGASPTWDESWSLGCAESARIVRLDPHSTTEYPHFVLLDQIMAHPLSQGLPTAGTYYVAFRVELAVSGDWKEVLVSASGEKAVVR